MEQNSQELTDMSEVTDEIEAPESVSSDKESDNTLEPGIGNVSEPQKIIVEKQPLSVKDPLSKKGLRFTVVGWVVEVYSVQKNHKRFARVLGKIEETPGEEEPNVRPFQDGDDMPLKKGYVFTLQGWAYVVNSVRSQNRRFLKRLGKVKEVV